MMEAVTDLEEGTAPGAAIPGYRVAGKTGTAQRVGENCGCYDGTFTVSFAGFAPADDPRFVVYVVVQNPTNGGGGGSVGGPAFRKIMTHLLQKYAVPPTGSVAPRARRRVVTSGAQTPPATSGSGPGRPHVTCSLSPVAGPSGVIPTRPRSPRETPLRTVAEWLVRLAAGDPRERPRSAWSPAWPSARSGCSPATSTSPRRAPARTARRSRPRPSRPGPSRCSPTRPGPTCATRPASPCSSWRSPRAVVGELAARLYGRPAERLRLVAVTGTQGKTTTTRLAEAALTEAGVRAAVVGTVGTRVNGTDVATSLTTPEAPDLHALFAVMAEEHVEACAMEVSSHALVMGRVDGVVFDVACFTNLGRDHLDFHADEEEYFDRQGRPVHPAARPPRAGQRRRRARPPAGCRRRPSRCAPSRPPAATADWWADDVRVEPGGSTLHRAHPRRGDRERRGCR